LVSPVECRFSSLLSLPIQVIAKRIRFILPNQTCAYRSISSNTETPVRPSTEVIAMREEKIRRVDVFFYGLFMDDALLREKGMNPVDRRMASVENFSLVIGARATLVPRAGRTVHGVLFSLTHAEVDALYSEDSVRVYRPEAVFAHLTDGSVTPALCFNLPVPPSTDERNPEYLSKLRELAARIGLPPSYVSSIQ
jgi:hypothetical protein